MLVYSAALPGRELGKRLALGQSSKSRRSISAAWVLGACSVWLFIPLARWLPAKLLAEKEAAVTGGISEPLAPTKTAVK